MIVKLGGLTPSERELERKEERRVFWCLSSLGPHPGEATFLSHTERLGVSASPRCHTTGRREAREGVGDKAGLAPDQAWATDSPSCTFVCEPLPCGRDKDADGTLSRAEPVRKIRRQRPRDAQAWPLLRSV